MHLSCARLALIVTLLLTPFTYSQTWDRQIDGGLGFDDELADSALSSSGELHLLATTGTSVDADLLVVKLDARGNMVWQRRVDGPGASEDLASAIALDSAGDVYVTGRTHDPAGSVDVYTLRLSGIDGTIVWEVATDGNAGSLDEGRDVAIAPDGAVYVTGTSFNENGDRDFLTLKFDAGGQALWRSRNKGPGLGTDADDVADFVALHPAGDVIIGGFSQNAAIPPEDVWVLRLGAIDGAEQWSYRYDGGLEDTPKALVLDDRGDVYVAADTQQTGRKLLSLKLDGATGAELWAYVDDPGGRDLMRAVAVHPNGDPIFTARSDPDGDESNTNDDVFTTRRQSLDGAVVWSSRFGDSDFGAKEEPEDLVIEPDGTIWVTGARVTAGEGLDVMVLELRELDGTARCVGSFSGPALGSDFGLRLHLGADGSRFLAGELDSASDGRDLVGLHFTDRDLLFDIESNVAGDGDTVAFALCGGIPGSRGLIAVISVDGFSLFVPVIRLTFDGGGVFETKVVVPPGLVPLDLELLGFGFTPLGLGFSTLEPLRLR